jgi:hypothetical protein
MNSEIVRGTKEEFKVFIIREEGELLKVIKGTSLLKLSIF